MQPQWDGLITFLGTDDLRATDLFYREILGLELYKDQEVCKIYQIKSGGKLGFCAHMPVTRDSEKKSPILTFLTSDVDLVYQQMQKAGFEISEPPKENQFFRIYHFFVQDPNGYTVEIQRFL